MSTPTPEPLPGSYEYGFVVGRVLRAMADTAEDVDDKPQARAAAGQVLFKPTEVLRKVLDDGTGKAAFITSGTEVATLSSSGRILDGEGRQGIWLVTGEYQVTFKLTDSVQGIPDFTIEVTADSTAAAPLDLAAAAPYTPPTGTTVVTYSLPPGGTDGQVLTRAGSAAGGAQWSDLAAATGGVDSVNGQTGEVTLTAGTVGAATAAQGAKADTAVQPAGLTKAAVGLDNVDNTADTAKPVSTAQAAAIAAAKARSSHTGTQPSSTISDFTEAAQDAVAAMLSGASGVTLSYNDAANTLTITGGGAGGLDAEAVRDAIGVAMVGAGLINIVVNDAADTITIATTATANDTNASLRDRATHTGAQDTSTITDLDDILAGKANSEDVATNLTDLAGLFSLDQLMVDGVKMVMYNTGSSTWPSSPAGGRMDIHLIFVGGDDAHQPPAIAGRDVWLKPTA